MTKPISLFPRLRDENGATLVEVLVALAIASAAIFVLAQGLSGRVGRNPVSEGIATLKDAISEGRLLAQTRQEPIRLSLRGHEIILAGTGAAALPSQRRLRLPASLSGTILSAREFQTGGTATILLLPDGRSSGGQIELTDGQTRGRVAIDDQTSRVTTSR